MYMCKGEVCAACRQLVAESRAVDEQAATRRKGRTRARVARGDAARVRGAALDPCAQALQGGGWGARRRQRPAE
jgi:hypothetical protein